MIFQEESCLKQLIFHLSLVCGEIERPFSIPTCMVKMASLPVVLPPLMNMNDITADAVQGKNLNFYVTLA